MAIVDKCQSVRRDRHTSLLITVPRLENHDFKWRPIQVGFNHWKRINGKQSARWQHLSWL